jgi:hypothetical protein
MQTIATFTGTLLLRKRMPGKPFVQLIFREAGKDWLCLSSNIAHVAKLQIGKNYKIEGLFKSLGERDYIHEPEIMPLARVVAKRRVWISLVIALAILLTGTGIVLAATHKDTPKPLVAPVAQQTSSNNPVTDTSTDATTTPVPTDTPPATTPAAATPKTPKTPKTTPIVPVTPPTTPVVTPPAPYCDSPVTTLFGYQTVTDQNQPVDYSHVTTPGVDGVQQTCYPDGTSASAVTTVQVVEQDQITTVGPTSPPAG